MFTRSPRLRVMVVPASPRTASLAAGSSDVMMARPLRAADEIHRRANLRRHAALAECSLRVHVRPLRRPTAAGAAAAAAFPSRRRPRRRPSGSTAARRRDRAPAPRPRDPCRPPRRFPPSLASDARRRARRRRRTAMTSVPSRTRRSDHAQLTNRLRRRDCRRRGADCRGRPPSPRSPSASSCARALRRQRPPDEFRRLAERRVRRVDLHLRDDRGHAPRTARPRASAFSSDCWIM